MTSKLNTLKSKAYGSSHFSPSDLSLKRSNRSVIKHAKKTGKRVCGTCGDSIAHQEAGEDTCDNCA